MKAAAGFESFARGRPSSRPANPGPRRLNVLLSRCADRVAIDSDAHNGPDRHTHPVK